MRVGKIVEVKDHPQARKPMYILTVDLGEEIGTRTIVAGIKDQYSKEELYGRLIVCLVNLDYKNIANVESQGMLLAAEDPSTGAIAIIAPIKEVKPGSKVR